MKQMDLRSFTVEEMITLAGECGEKAFRGKGIPGEAAL